MRVVIITQARMTSTRLPGKVLKEVQGKTLLEHHIERLQRVASADQVVVATTLNATDDVIVKLCQRLNVSFYRGSEEDVLSRYYEAALKFQADVIVRVTSDCPVIDPAVVEQMVQKYLEEKTKYDYISNGLKRTYPTGMDTEVFSIKVLQEAFKEATDPSDREHVTPFISRKPHRYQLGNMVFQESQKHHRWTVDTEEDLRLITNLFNVLYPINKEFNMANILDLLKQNPEWSNINAHIIPKVPSERTDIRISEILA
jgi:spore coat polysaccharide biosynthesis protein SpsF